MGSLYYATAPPVAIPDRLLAHLRAVVTVKLRRNERFAVSFAPADGDGIASTTLWFAPAIPLRFEFDSDQAESLDPVLLQELASQANSTRGVALQVAPASLAVLAGA
ncbi:MAG TPA: hypothetical protein VJR25_12880 [Microbacterium sp.]|uniref:DUF7882 family protein n=1 Tax=Microbacterium sp. TaxID=51671 RepID=UPI002B49238C|nr:hypothetical protein [Microbacterium sp.]HKT57660.1 hypothetical protein [Microbacterium sp.]